MRFIKVKKTGESWQQPSEFGTAWTDDELNHWFADWAEVSDPPHGLEYPFYDGDKWVEHNAVSSEERIHRLSDKNSSDWKEHDNLYTQWQKAEKLGWTVATKRKKAFDEHTKKVAGVGLHMLAELECINSIDWEYLKSCATEHNEWSDIAPCVQNKINSKLK